MILHRFRRGIVNRLGTFSLSPLVPLFWFFTRLSSDSNPIEEKKRRRRRRRESCMNNWFPGREWMKARGRACLRRLYSRSPLDGIKLVINANTLEKGAAFRLKYHAKIYSNWFPLAPRLIHYATVSSQTIPPRINDWRDWRTRRNWSNRFDKATNSSSREKENIFFEYFSRLIIHNIIVLLYEKGYCVQCNNTFRLETSSISEYIKINWNEMLRENNHFRSNYEWTWTDWITGSGRDYLT